MGFRIQVRTAVGHGTIHARCRQRVAKLLSPGLAGNKREQLNYCVRGDQILPGQPGAIVENLIICGNSRIVQESAQHFETGLHRSARSFFASEEPQQNFGVKILTDFVHHLNVFRKRW